MLRGAVLILIDLYTVADLSPV